MRLCRVWFIRDIAAGVENGAMHSMLAFWTWAWLAVLAMCQMVEGFGSHG